MGRGALCALSLSRAADACSGRRDASQRRASLPLARRRPATARRSRRPASLTPSPDRLVWQPFAFRRGRRQRAMPARAAQTAAWGHSQSTEALLARVLSVYLMVGRSSTLRICAAPRRVLLGGGAARRAMWETRVMCRRDTVECARQRWPPRWQATHRQAPWADLGAWPRDATSAGPRAAWPPQTLVASVGTALRPPSPPARTAFLCSEEEANDAIVCFVPRFGSLGNLAVRLCARLVRELNGLDLSICSSRVCARTLKGERAARRGRPPLCVALGSQKLVGARSIVCALANSHPSALIASSAEHTPSCRP